MNRLLNGLVLFLVALSLVFSFCACTQKGEAASAVEKVTLNKKTLELNAGDSFTLIASASPTDASQDFVWTSSSSKYATVSETGLVTVKNTTDDTQTVKITATSKSDSSKKATCTITVKVKTTVSKIGMITCGPGENASESVVISWHSPSKGSYLEYTDAGGSVFSNSVANADCNEVLSSADWADIATHYRCKVVLSGLSPDSVYKYQIKDANGTVADTASFKTAAADTTNFSFMWLSDLHTPSGSSSYIKRINELISFAKDQTDLDFCLFTGDMVEKGQVYKHWNYWSSNGLLKNMVFAFLPGNHDYYDHNSKTRTTNAYFMDVCAYPDNNDCNSKSVADSNYWFIWNKVLFVCVDSISDEGTKMSSAGTSVSEQKAWFEEVVKANAGKYDYLVFAQHYPFFKEDNKYCDYGNYDSWYPLFDEYGVDFALSSDEHAYLRTKPMLNDVATELEGGKVKTGTVYVVSDQTEGGAIDSLSNSASPTAKYAAFNAGGGVAGAYFTVTSSEMTLHVIGQGGTEYDSVTVIKKDR